MVTEQNKTPNNINKQSNQTDNNKSTEKKKIV
jgi:hypothetical protein